MGNAKRSTLPALFAPHPNLADDVNCAIVQSEIEGGIFLNDIPKGTVLDIQTRHRWYRMMYMGEGKAEISGHPQYCPEPVPVMIHGSTWGGSMLKVRYIGRGLHLEFQHPAFGAPIVTSSIVDIRESCRQEQ
jgi:hypothetical protein